MDGSRRLLCTLPLLLLLLSVSRGQSYDYDFWNPASTNVQLPSKFHNLHTHTVSISSLIHTYPPSSTHTQTLRSLPNRWTPWCNHCHSQVSHPDHYFTHLLTCTLNALEHWYSKVTTLKFVMLVFCTQVSISSNQTNTQKIKIQFEIWTHLIWFGRRMTKPCTVLCGSQFLKKASFHFTKWAQILSPDVPIVFYVVT